MKLLKAAWSAFLVSAFSLSVSAAEGLIGRYYSGYAVASNRITFDGLTLVSTQTNTLFDLWNGSQSYDWNPIGAGFYSVHWTGFLHTAESGVYGFGTISDDGSEIWIDGQRLIDNNEEQWYDWQEGYQYLGAGYHSIEITFYEAQSFSGIEIWWLRPSAGASPLPYSGETFHSTPPTFNASTQWEILPPTVLSTEAPFVNPRLTASLSGATQVILSWNGFANVNYVVETSTNLFNWVEHTGPLPGFNGAMTQPVDKSVPREFFRLRVE